MAEEKKPAKKAAKPAAVKAQKAEKPAADAAAKASKKVAKPEADRPRGLSARHVERARAQQDSPFARPRGYAGGARHDRAGEASGSGRRRLVIAAAGPRTDNPAGASSGRRGQGGGQ